MTERILPPKQLKDTTGQNPVSKLSPEDVATFGLTHIVTDPVLLSPRAVDLRVILKSLEALLPQWVMLATERRGKKH